MNFKSKLKNTLDSKAYLYYNKAILDKQVQKQEENKMKNTTTIQNHYEAYSEEEAWNIANQIFPTDYEYDAALSARAGYPVYPSTCSDYRFAKINDLNARLEVVFEDYTCVNIWILDKDALIEKLQKENAELKAKLEAVKGLLN